MALCTTCEVQNAEVDLMAKMHEAEEAVAFNTSQMYGLEKILLPRQ